MRPTAQALSAGQATMHRLYNPNSGEHFYTASAVERDTVIAAGWRYEGTGWTAPAVSGTPVQRLCNTNAGDHHYTMSAAERDMLVGVGWIYEGIGWYSDDAQSIALLHHRGPLLLLDLPRGGEHLVCRWHHREHRPER